MGEDFMAKHSIGKMIAALRKEQGWTQVDLAEKLNISDKTISKWESEAGYPEFTMLPQLANMFDVSLDYLMTGKKTEPKIITISKAELCAKTDDISLLNDVNYTQTDENNKCLIDYIKQYESLNVFAALCAADKKALSSFDILTALKFSLLSNHVELLKDVGFGWNVKWYLIGSIARKRSWDLCRSVHWNILEKDRRTISMSAYCRMTFSR